MKALKDAFSSRKFVLTLSGIVFIILNRALGLHVEEEAVTKIVGLIAAYCVGQGFVDGMQAHGSDAQEMRSDDKKP